MAKKTKVKHDNHVMIYSGCHYWIKDYIPWDEYFRQYLYRFPDGFVGDAGASDRLIDMVWRDFTWSTNL